MVLSSSSSRRSPRWLLKNLWMVALPVVVVSSLVVLQRQRLATLQDSHATAPGLEQQAQATATTLTLAQKMPAFGFDNLVADWFFLRFLQYFGDDQARASTGYGLSPEFFEIIIANDPYYRNFYLFLSGSVSNFAGRPERAVAITADGLEHLTPTLPDDSFYIWRYRGIDELLYLGDGAAAQTSYQTAADWARQSAHPDAAIIAESSQRTADFLANNPLSKQAQVSAWASVFANAFDDGTRQKAIDRIKALGGNVFVSESGEVKLQFPPDD
ncbi:hypothetical protein IQ254_17885 [Nodosilinea sp. LEGE 07088]|uniref:hypothetical protein n=1 Tax=Nodosilinea sp. LEGE 07088 TaxID=2777968 RepID=UPI001881E79F|nr:hypothetical protein [Nodosilinea sp. LEGE 07088]MBE9139041.1 hypothetical protein [Nodosilinea sp. LEGE 07088]